jgi:opacity protein-like surface antigen
MKKILCLVVMTILIAGGTAAAQERTVPMLREGVKEVGINGFIDFEGAQGDVDAVAEALFGYFLNRHLEVGGFLSYSRANDGDDITYGVGAFAEYHIFGARWVGFAETVPYFGASVGLGVLDSASEENESALTFIPKVGVKWFFRDYVALDTNVFLALATEDIYLNDGSSDSYDFGMRFGLRVLFQ